MESFEKKLIAQLDDPMPGQRMKALELLHAHDETHNSSFCGRILKIERGETAETLEHDVAVLQQENFGLREQSEQRENELTQYKDAVTQWQQHAKSLETKLARASAIAWGRTTGRRLALYAVLPVFAFVGWQAYQRYWPLPAGVNSGLHRIAAAADWGVGCSRPTVRNAGGQPYWIMLCGRIDTRSSVDGDGETIGLHCIDVYAQPAKTDWQTTYERADPYGLFGWWINWPRLAVECQRSD